MTDARCDRTDLLVSACAHCRGDQLDPAIEADLADAQQWPVRQLGQDPTGPETKVDLLAGPVKPTRYMTALYGTPCPACSGKILPGDRIGLVGDYWICEDCAG